jgi:hypothetical protein
MRVGTRPAGRGQTGDGGDLWQAALTGRPGGGSVASATAIELLVCPRCGGPRRILGAVTEPGPMLPRLGCSTHVPYLLVRAGVSIGLATQLRAFRLSSV